MLFEAPITLSITAATIIISIRAFSDNVLKGQFMFNPYFVTQKDEVHRLFSHGLIHADWMHLFFNMYVLYSFGSLLETSDFFLGSFGFLVIYVVALPLSCLPNLILQKDNIHYNALGASGAVSAILGSFILFMPRAPLSLIFIPISIEAWIMGLLYMAYSFYMSIRKIDNIGHDAHLWGFLGGIVMTLVMKPETGPAFLAQLGF